MIQSIHTVVTRYKHSVAKRPYGMDVQLFLNVHQGMYACRPATQALGIFAAGFFAIRIFAIGTFAVRVFCRTEFSPSGIIPCMNIWGIVFHKTISIFGFIPAANCVFHT